MPQSNFDDLVEDLGRGIKTKLQTQMGQGEANMRTPIEEFLTEVGSYFRLKVVAHDEVHELDGRTRLDWAISVDGVVTGWVELKTANTEIEPKKFPKSHHNYEQWQSLKELPNLILTNGRDWRLYRYGELVGTPSGLASRDIATHRGKITASPGFEVMLHDFLTWEPAPIVTVNKLIEQVAPLTRGTRESVISELRAERRLKREGKDESELPMLGAAKDWRKVLFPGAKDIDFANSFAQTVTFALLLAVSEGIELTMGLDSISRKLKATNYGIMGKTLDLLTRHTEDTRVSPSINALIRVLSAADWKLLSRKSDDLYLHLYEQFLEAYDPSLRETSGSYYTPVPVVEGMVQFVDQILKHHLGRPRGLRSADVAIIDPASGTGTFPLAVIRHVAAGAEQEYGSGARSEAVASLAERLYGIEIQSGPHAVAELRLSQTIQNYNVALPESGLKLFVADTLEDPSFGEIDLSYDLGLIAKQRKEANRIKREENITVVIGNPPYDDDAGGRGGWVENGNDRQSPLMDDFKTGENPQLDRKLKNLYTYFWRWGAWKVFESTSQIERELSDKGLVCFITASGYLTSDAYKGMRSYVRRNCTHGWIINISPEGKRPPAGTGIFDIETPVAIGVFLKNGEINGDMPANIQYIEKAGRRDEKFDFLLNLTLSDPGWLDVYQGATDTFTPAPKSDWTDYPFVGDIFPWSNTGVTPRRNWVYSPSEDTLYGRFAALVSESDYQLKREMFRVTETCAPEKGKKPLAGTVTDTATPISALEIAPSEIETELIQFHSFDRQHIIADSRLIDRPCPSLWEARKVEGQVFVVEAHTHALGPGPGLYFTKLLPGQDCFDNRGGRALPLFHPNGDPNVSPALVEIVSAHINESVTPRDVVDYVAGITGHRGYVSTFKDELRAPGVRIPITADLDLWRKVVVLGRQVQSCMSLGDLGDDPDFISSLLPEYTKPVGKYAPEGYSYDSERQVLRVGEGEWSNVSQEVFEYTVGGYSVVRGWLNYRKMKPIGKQGSPLNRLNESRWLPEWSLALTDTLRSLQSLVDLEPELMRLLLNVLHGPIIRIEDLVSGGALYPSASSRKPRRLDHQPSLHF